MKILLVFLILFFIIYVYFSFNYSQMTYVESNIDYNYYLVRDDTDKQKASNLLSKIKINIDKLANYCYENRYEYNNMKPYIEQLYRRIQNSFIVESNKNSTYTSYSVNKGEQLVFCIRSKDNNENFHDLNLLMYVVIHELAHVGCPEYGHTPLFKEIFVFLCEISIKINIYKKINFEVDNKEYCGMTITESVI